MIDSLINNPNGYCDNLCNLIISYSSTVAKELGITYGELWIGITGLILLLIIVYNFILILSLHYKLKYIKYVYWIINIITFGFIFFTIGDFLIYCKQL